MKFRKMNAQAATTIEKPKERYFDPATWARQPRLLARNRADAAVIKAIMLILAVDAMGLLMAVLVRPLVWPDELLMGMILLIALAGGVMFWRKLPARLIVTIITALVGVSSVTLLALVSLHGQFPGWQAAGMITATQATILIMIWAWAYASGLRTMTDDARRATWMQEDKLGVDLDGDGHIGNPQRKIRLVNVNAGGEAQEPVVMLDDDDAEQVLLDGFDLAPADVAAWVSEAWKRGLARSAWLTRPRWRFPSGRKISRSDWERLTSECERLGWTQRSLNGASWAVRRIDVLRQLEELN